MMHTISSIDGPYRVQQNRPASPDEKREMLADWIGRVLHHYDISAYKFSQRSGVSKQQIGRYLKPNTGSSMPKIDTLTSLADAAVDVPLPAGLLPTRNGQRPVTGFAEPEMKPVSMEKLGACPLEPGSASQSVWQITTRAIELPPYAYLPGDYVLLDEDAKAGPGQAVCAQIYDRQGGAETVFRAYEPPFLVTATADPDARHAPLFVDGDKVIVKGPVIKSVRMTTN